MEKQELLYEGKAKKVYATQDPKFLIVAYKDDATAFNGLKKGTIQGKGVINNRMSNLLMSRLEREGIPTHLVEELSARETLVKKVSIVPLEVIVRNIAAGSFSKRYGVEEGLVFDTPTLEFSYKNDALGDPLLNDDHAVALGLASREELALIRKYALVVNEVLEGLSRRQIWAEMKALCAKAGVERSKVFPHNLRHLFARSFYRACRDVVKLADVLGHSNIETTRIYLISTGAEHARQLERLGLVS